MTDKFYIGSTEFHDIAQLPDFGLSDINRDTFLELYKHWGLLYQLSNSEVVLRPQELTKVMSSVITASQVSGLKLQRINNGEKGFLYHDKLEEVWDDAVFANLQPSLLKLLHDCNLAFEIFAENGNSAGCSLVPAMLSSIGSMADFDRMKQVYEDLNLGPEQAVVVLQNSFIPMNLLPLLMSRLKRHVIKDQLWSDVCVVSYNESSFVIIYRPLYSQESGNVSEESDNLYI